MTKDGGSHLALAAVQARVSQQVHGHGKLHTA